MSRPALNLLHLLAAATVATFKSRTVLQVENLALVRDLTALRYQLAVLRRSVKRPKLIAADRLLSAWLSELWTDWRSSLLIVAGNRHWLAPQGLSTVLNLESS
jgi:hypothetical protein